MAIIAHNQPWPQKAPPGVTERASRQRLTHETTEQDEHCV